MSSNGSLPSDLASRLKRYQADLATAELYRKRPWAFAIGGRGLPPILGPVVMRKAAHQEVLAFAPQQKVFLRDFCDVTVSNLIAKTGRGCAKTFGAAISIADLAWTFPTFTCTVNAGSLDQAKTLYDYWKAFCEAPAMLDPIGPVVDEPTMEETKLRNGGWIKIRAASERQAKSRHPHMVVLDEACATDEEIMLLVEGQLVGAPLLPGATAPLYRVMSTPDKLHHRFRQLWEERKERGYVGRHWTAYDCPWMTPDAIAQWILDHSKNDVRIHIKGEFGARAGTVFDYDDIQTATLKTLQDDPTGLWSLIEMDPSRWIDAAALGVDWGNVNPTVLVVVVLVHIGDIPIYYVVHVEGHSRMPAQQLYERIARAATNWRADTFMDANDSRANMEITPILARQDLSARSVAFGKFNMAMIGGVNAVLEKIQLRVPLAGEGAILLRQLADYEWDPVAAERGLEKPIKDNDDFVDALKLAIWGLRHEGEEEGPGVLQVLR